MNANRELDILILLQTPHARDEPKEDLQTAKQFSAELLHDEEVLIFIRSLHFLLWKLEHDRVVLSCG